jgi:endonuclease/exonuclease/phosphatase family metal-dependent hydrolase
MPVQDWTRVDAGLFHDFHQGCTVALRSALNTGVLPPDYFALVDRNTRGPIPDVLTLQLSVGPGKPTNGATGLAVAAAPPQAELIRRQETKTYARRANCITMRHRHGDVVAVIDIMSPGNKASRAEFRAFVRKSVDLIQQGVNMGIPQEETIAGEGGSGWLLGAAGLLVLAVAALWLAGAFRALRPELFGSLLALALLGGMLLGGWAGWRLWRQPGDPARLAGMLVGLAAAASAVCFAVRVLGNTEGPQRLVNRPFMSAQAPQRLRLVDLNVLHGYPEFTDHEERFADTTAALRALAPDILVLQEAWSTAEHGNMAERLAEALGLHHVYARANGSQRLIGFEEGAAILSRFPLKSAHRLVLPPRQPWWENRIALVAELDLGGETLTVVGAHLTCHGDEANEAQAQSLVQRLPTRGLVLVAGDLNADSDSGAVRHFAGAGYLDTVGGGIDHVLVPRDLAARAGWTLRPDDLAGLIAKRSEISDHPGIVVDLVRIRPGPAAGAATAAPTPAAAP